MSQSIDDDELVNETIRRTVLGLMHGRGFRKEDLAKVLGCSRGTAFNKLTDVNPRPFTFAEAVRMAKFFRVSLADLQDGCGGLFAPAARMSDLGLDGETAEPRRLVGAVDSAVGGWRARQDSNLQPSDPLASTTAPAPLIPRQRAHITDTPREGFATPRNSRLDAAA